MNKKANFNELKEAKTIKELVSILDYSLLTNASLIILAAVILTPFIALFIGYPLFLINYILFLGYLGCIVTFIYFFKSRFSSNISTKKYLFENIIPIFLFSMLIWAIPSTIFATDFNIAFSGSAYRQTGLLMAFAYCGYFGCGYIVVKSQKLNYIFNVFSFVAVILSVLMIINSPFINAYLETTRDCSVFFNRNHTGYYFCMSAILSTIEILKLKLKSKKEIALFIFRLIIIGICLYASILTYSTGPFLGIIFGGCCLIFATSLFNRKLLIHTISIFATFIITITIAIFTGDNPLIDSFKILFDLNSIFKNPQSDEALHAGSSRWFFWLETLKFIKERPLFGYGLDCLGPEFSKVGIDYDKPHCEPLQFAAELGIPAAIAYLVAIFSFVFSFFKKKIDNPLIIGLVCTVGAYFFSSLFGNTMFYTSPFFFMIFGMATSVLKRA
ncbi:MAG: O-antigen ligase family protein [Clostridia bacterium]|nr:O-antigen ligase family protein [Clostridia bacterium]